ncbi:hypothetical protein Pmani_034153 [Petrolisthes manimaculis]|uniref:Programmed cell death protein 7 n=1 Tax=Petrolisthes manimaculis TaxID=1843537 RepID=A0AAE1NP94_9EUCA|nr:hypothetical protein Pmani_034153 [Petrolisthes manimaculis]
MERPTTSEGSWLPPTPREQQQTMNSNSGGEQQNHKNFTPDSNKRNIPQPSTNHFLQTNMYSQAALNVNSNNNNHTSSCGPPLPPNSYHNFQHVPTFNRPPPPPPPLPPPPPPQNVSGQYFFGDPAAGKPPHHHPHVNNGTSYSWQQQSGLQSQHNVQPQNSNQQFPSSLHHPNPPNQMNSPSHQFTLPPQPHPPPHQNFMHHPNPPSYPNPVSHPNPPSYPNPVSHPNPPSYPNQVSQPNPPLQFNPVTPSHTPSMHQQNSSHESIKDANWIKQFENTIEKRQTSESIETSSEERKLKLGEVVRLLAEAEGLSETLSTLEQELTKSMETSTETEWQDLVLQADAKRKSLSLILTRFQDETFVQQVKKLLHHRRMKRVRARKSKINKRLEKKEKEKRAREEEAKIDAWREKLQQEEQQKRREAVVKREADSVLGEVRQKQSEARRMLEVLTSMGSLRQTRLKKQVAHGHVSSPTADQQFTDSLKKIEEVVRSQVKQYQLEEQTLCVMLEGTTSHKSAARGRDTSLQYEESLKKVLFGEHQPLDTQTLDSFTLADHCLETLAYRRLEWDKYVSEDRLPLASSIPMNWVIPPTQPSPAWAQYLKPTTSHS